MKSGVKFRLIAIHMLLFTFYSVVHGSARDHTFHGSAFDFNVWRRGSDGFQCPHDQQYVILCKLRWDIIIGELELCMDGGVQCANGTVVTSTVIIAIEAIAIGALLIYACRMRKKVIRNAQNWMVRLPRHGSIDSNDTTKA